MTSSVSPLATLERGYALATDQTGSVITYSGQVDIDQPIDVRVARGSLGCVVKEINNEE